MSAKITKSSNVLNTSMLVSFRSYKGILIFTCLVEARITAFIVLDHVGFILLNFLF